MNQKRKYHVGIESLKETLPESTIADLAGIKTAAVKKYSRILDRNGYMAFGPALLDVSIASLATRGKLHVLQVGANDGKEGDPVRDLFHRYSSQTILVEPIPGIIERLKENYCNHKGALIIENCAISNTSDVFELWCLKSQYWGEYVERVGRHPTAIASFDIIPLTEKISDRMGVAKDTAKEMLEVLCCPAMTLDTLLKKHNWKRLDVLQIDAEGYDFEVVRSLGRFRPRIINFESFNLSKEDWESWKSWAKKENYGYVQGRMDTLAIRGADFNIDY